MKDFNIEDVLEVISNDSFKFKKFLNFLLCDKKLMISFYHFNKNNSCVLEKNKDIYYSFFEKMFLLYPYESSDGEILDEFLSVFSKQFMLKMRAFNVNNKDFKNYLTKINVEGHENSTIFFKYLINVIKNDNLSDIDKNKIILSEVESNVDLVNKASEKLFGNFQYVFSCFKKAELYKFFNIIRNEHVLAEDFKGVLLYAFKHKHKSSVIQEIISDIRLCGDKKFRGDLIGVLAGDSFNKEPHTRSSFSVMLFRSFKGRLMDVEGFVLLNACLVKFGSEFLKRYRVKGGEFSLDEMMNNIKIMGGSSDDISKICIVYAKYKLEKMLVDVDVSKVNKI